MANICENELRISGVNVKRFVDQAKSVQEDGSLTVFSFSKFIPVLENQSPDALWGTRNDASDAELDGISDDAEVTLFDGEDTEIVYSFNTPWSPPENFTRSVSKLFPELTFTLWYFESGNQFTGISVYKNGQEVSRRYAENETPEYWQISGQDPTESS